MPREANWCPLMSPHEDPTATDRTEIEALIGRLEADQLSETDTRLISRLLRLLLKLINLESVRKPGNQTAARTR